MFTPKPLEYERDNYVLLQGRKVKVVFSMTDPDIILFEDVISNTVCDVVTDLVKVRVTRSNVFENSTGASVLDDARTSYGASVARGEHSHFDSIDSTLANLAKWPLERSEMIQFLQYTNGQFYVPHFDFFHPDQPGSASTIERHGNRIATMILYLEEPEIGGSTFFPDLNLKIMPKKGSVLFFSYDRPSKETRTLHSGEPVISGSKTIATKWFREKPFI